MVGSTTIMAFHHIRRPLRGGRSGWESAWCLVSRALSDAVPRCVAWAVQDAEAVLPW